METLPDSILQAHGLRAAQVAERSGLATIWRVTRGDGSPAALKVYHGSDMANEAPGFALMQALDGHGAALVHSVGRTTALMEWLDGPSLGDMVRAGDDVTATAELAATATRLHARALPCDGLPALADWFAALFALRFAPDCPAPARRDIAAARALARRLLDSQGPARGLHGDLHHDNIRLCSRGYVAFDAKGVAGDIGYELANALRNPSGVPDLIRDPAVLLRRASVWAPALGQTPDRLLQWGAAKCALSIAWRAGGTLARDRELDLLSILLGLGRA